MLLGGDWESALIEARRSVERFTRGALNQLACGNAFYCQGEVHRLRGEFDSGRAGVPPGEPEWMRAAARPGTHAAGAGKGGLGRSRYPPVHRRDDGCRCDVRESCPLTWRSCSLSEASTSRGPPVASSTKPRKRLDCEALRRDGRTFPRSHGARRRPRERRADRAPARAGPSGRSSTPRMKSRASGLAIGLACRTLEDHDTAALELEAARSTFKKLGAVTDLARVASLAATADATAAADARADRARTRRCCG